MINKKGNIQVAIAVIIAGLIIGAAIIYTNKTPATEDKLTLQLTAYAEAAGVDKKDFQQCLKENKYDEEVKKDFQNAVDTGGQGTPYSLIVGPNNLIVPISGALPLENWKTAISDIKEKPDEIIAKLPPAEENPLLKMNPVNESDWVYGNRDAVIKIVEYTDTECPFCARVHPTLKQLVDESNGEIAWVYRHFPLTQLHPNAPIVSNASECAGALGGNDAFWKFIDLAYEKADERK